MVRAHSFSALVLASLCPYLNGNVVYQARAFYRILFEDDGMVFNDLCGYDNGDDNEGGKAGPNSAAGGISEQGYSLFPNPNEGSFMLRQMVADAAPVAIEIKDVLGRSVYSSGSITFSNGSTQLQLCSLTSGVYVLQITDNKGKISNFKFVVQ